jgi:hypothetical protein
MKMNAIYSTGQVAGMLGLTEPQLNNLVRRRIIPLIPVGPTGRRVWTVPDIEAAREALAARRKPKPVLADAASTQEVGSDVL